MDRFTELQRELADIITHSDVPTDSVHSLSTRRWLLALHPEASEELQIAALAHDIDRAVPPRTTKEKDETYDAFKERHAKRSAQLIADLMQKYGYDEGAIGKTFRFVERHEVGGDPETDFLTDADSISYFEDNIAEYFRKNGYETTKDKVAFMFVRASDRAKNIISKMTFDHPDIARIVKEVVVELNQ